MDKSYTSIAPSTFDSYASPSVFERKSLVGGVIEELEELRARVKVLNNLTDINKEIQGVYVSNEIDIKKIESYKGSDVLALNYVGSVSVLEDQTCALEAYEEEQFESTDAIIDSFKCIGKLLKVPDHLNDKIDFTLENYEHCKDLNEKTASVSAKFEALFEENNKKIIPIMLQHADNIITVGENLKRLISLLQDHKSKLDTIKGKMEEVNAILRSLYREHGVKFTIDFGDFAESTILVTPGPKTILAEFIPGFKGAPTLIYQGHTHGLDAEMFHKYCDGKVPTVSIIRGKPCDNKGKVLPDAEAFVFGGYTDVPFSSKEGYVASNNSFLFTITNPGGFEPTKFPLLGSKNASAIYHGKSFGPNFGGKDLQVSFDKPSSAEFPHAYTDKSGIPKLMNFFTGSPLFMVSDVEVWLI